MMGDPQFQLEPEEELKAVLDEMSPLAIRRLSGMMFFTNLFMLGAVVLLLGVFFQLRNIASTVESSYCLNLAETMAGGSVVTAELKPGGSEWVVFLSNGDVWAGVTTTNTWTRIGNVIQDGRRD